VQRAAIVKAEAIPAIVDAVKAGHMPVKQAVLVARLSLPRQQQVAAEMHNGKSLSTTVLAASRVERAETIERAAQHVPLSALGRTFPVLYADPPWAFQAWSAGGQQKAAEMHYPTMSVAEICALPVAEIAARDSVLFMWALPAMFPEALSVVSAWGFTFKTFAVWVKPSIACGHWFRGQHEPLIVATRGNMPPPSALHSSVFSGETSGRHSEKPEAVRDWIAAAYPDVGRIELFARTASPGWVPWGNQAPGTAP
jgi:N6-adenosine-specific RNA methylase IME4